MILKQNQIKQNKANNNNNNNKAPPYEPEILLLATCSKERNATCQSGICILVLCAALFTIAKIWSQSKYVLMDE